MIRCFSVVLLLSTLLIACTNDSAEEPNVSECDLSEVSFKTDVLPIIERSCSYASNCHATAAGNGDFTAYETLQEDLDNGKFADRVLLKKNMPPTYADEDRPKTLDDAEISIIQCWADGGYLNN